MYNYINELSLAKRLLYIAIFILFFSIINTIILDNEIEDYSFKKNTTLLSKNME